MTLFDEFNLSDELKKTIKGLGFEKPTEIQERSIPSIIEGKDIIGESATGSGKTLAFGCGVVEAVVPHKGIQAIILTPTRELAEQVNRSIKQLLYGKDIRTIPIYGGVSIEPQIRDLQKAEIVVATPGRFLDHLQRGTIDTSKVKIAVLDEADRMLDMGFIDDVEKILSACRNKEQTLLFSATMSPKIKSLAKKHLRNPVRVNVRNQVDPSKLKQVYYNISKNAKMSLLVKLLRDNEDGLVMIFCNTRRTTEFVERNLKANNIKATAIHGGLTQNKRSKTLDMFDKRKISALVCTDVAARGLHIDNVSHVFNYEIPKDPTDYVHRIGRTARAGEKGRVVNLLSEQDFPAFSKLFEQYREFNIEALEVPKLEKVNISRDSSSNSRGRTPFYRQRGGRRPSSGNRHRQRR